MNWKLLEHAEQIDTLVRESNNQPVVIFKHSTRCPLSRSVKAQLEAAGTPPDIDFYYLDLWRYRTVSDEVADRFKIRHQSPQVLLLKGGECTFNQDHTRIKMEEITAAAKNKAVSDQ